MTTTTGFQRRFESLGERLKWVRVFELGDPPRSKMAELLGAGFNDSTLKTWEDEGRTPRKVHEVAKRYEELAKAAGARHITADWILYGGDLKIVLHARDISSGRIAHAA